MADSLAAQKVCGAIFWPTAAWQRDSLWHLWILSALTFWPRFLRPQYPTKSSFRLAVGSFLYNIPDCSPYPGLRPPPPRRLTPPCQVKVHSPVLQIRPVQWSNYWETNVGLGLKVEIGKCKFSRYVALIGSGLRDCQPGDALSWVIIDWDKSIQKSDYYNDRTLQPQVLDEARCSPRP